MSCRFRVAWLLPVLPRGGYWHPVLVAFARLLPNTTVYTCLSPALAGGSEPPFPVTVVGRARQVVLDRTVSRFRMLFTILPLRIVFHLVQFRPRVVYCAGFSTWSALCIALKPILGLRVILLYDGSSPGVDMRARRLRVLLRRALARRADACLTNSRAGERYLVDVVKAGEGRVLRSHYLVPSLRALGGAVAQPAAPGGLARPVFLYVGRLSRLKGTHLLLESCAILKRRGRSDFSLLLVGDGPERPELRETARTLGLEPFLRWEGWVAYDRLSLYFRLSDVFVFPTLSDVWGMAAIEAMAYSKPVLCSRWAGVSDLVRPGENGFLFDPRSPESLADLMELYMDDRARISPMGIRSRELVAGLTPEAAALRLRDVAWRVCGLGGAPDGEG